MLKSWIKSHGKAKALRKKDSLIEVHEKYPTFTYVLHFTGFGKQGVQSSEPGSGKLSPAAADVRPQCRFHPTKCAENTSKRFMVALFASSSGNWYHPVTSSVKESPRKVSSESADPTPKIRETCKSAVIDHCESATSKYCRYLPYLCQLWDGPFLIEP